MRGGRLRFRYGGDQVRTRMYRSFARLREGWTKNLVLLFPSPTRLAILRLLEFSAVVGGVTVALVSRSNGRTVALVAGAVAVGVYAKVVWRVRKAHAGAVSTALSLLGLPLFSYLLLRSRLYYKWNRVTWKGRRYAMPQNHDAATTATPHSAYPATGE
jgi:hypothetical protein